MKMKLEDLKYDLKAQVKYDCDGKWICEKRTYADVKDQLKAVIKTVNEMKEYYGRDNKKFVKAYADFGQETYKNKYVFKNIYDKAKDCGLTLVYKITGEKVHRLKKQFNYPKTAACQL